jgi:hypothetical protein
LVGWAKRRIIKAWLIETPCRGPSTSIVFSILAIPSPDTISPAGIITSYPVSILSPHEVDVVWNWRKATVILVDEIIRVNRHLGRFE